MGKNKRFGFMRFNYELSGMEGAVPAPTYDITESSNDTAVTYTIDTNIVNGANLYYSTAGNVTANDFSDNTLTGEIDLDGSGNASLVRQISQNNIGLTRDFTVSIRTNSSSGNAVYTGNSVSIVDNVPIRTTNTNDFNNHIIANITIGSDLYQQHQISTNTTLQLTNGSGNYDANIGVLAIGGGGGGGMGTFGTAGGGGGGAGGVSESNVIFDANLSSSPSVVIGTGGNIASASGVGGTNTTITSWSISALGGDTGANANSTNGGDGGNSGSSSAGGGGGGLHGSDLSKRGTPGAIANVTFDWYGGNGYETTNYSQFVYRDRNYTSVTQKSVTPSGGSGAEFSIFLSRLTSTDANANAATYESLNLQLDGFGNPVRGTGYSVGDVIVIDGANIGGTSNIHDITYTVANVDGAGGLLGSTDIGTKQATLYSLPQNYDLANFSGISNPINWEYKDPDTDQTYGGDLNFFGGGGATSTTSLSGGVNPAGKGGLGQGGKGEHFRNTGSNPDMAATAGSDGAVLIRYKMFEPNRTIQIS